MRSQDHSQCSSHVVQGELLPKIDDYVDNMLGLAVFYQHVRTVAFNQHHQVQHVSVLTTELFAHYLHSRCLCRTMCRQFMQKSSRNDSRRYHMRMPISDISDLYIGDVLLSVLLSRMLNEEFYCKHIFQQCRQRTICPTKHNASYLVELLQKSAVEHLTTFREIEARDVGSVATIITTDFEALYTYKRGDYQQCLQLSTQNVHTLLYATRMPCVQTSPVFLQLLDDDIVSLIALTCIVNPKCRGYCYTVRILQVTLSLYLMTQCQLKLRHSAMSLTETLDYIRVAKRRHPVVCTLDHLVLKMIAHKALTYITTMMNETMTYDRLLNM